MSDLPWQCALCTDIPVIKMSVGIKRRSNLTVHKLINVGFVFQEKSLVIEFSRELSPNSAENWAKFFFKSH